MALSLRFRLNLAFNGLLAAAVGVGTVMAVLGARSAVEEELRSTAALARELLRIATETAVTHVDPAEPAAQTIAARLAEYLASSEHTRHLDIEVRGHGPATSAVPATGHAPQLAAPAWFLRWVEPSPEALTRTVSVGPNGLIQVWIRSDPTDEINEAWAEFRNTLLLFAGFAVVANGLVYALVGWSLRPIDAISAGLDAIGQGDYAHRLRSPRLPELGRIAIRVNRLAEALDLARAQNRNLTQRSLAIQEDERSRLAHELHDEMGQSITAIKAIAVSIAQRAEDRMTEVARNARTIAEVASAVHATVRNMMHRLRPVVLDELGLASAVEQLVDEWNARHADTFCALRVTGEFDALTEAQEISLFRIVQEALTNVVKHARAHRVDIDLTRTAADGKTRLRIADDGIGFEPSRQPRGLGLLGMEERVAAAGGTLRIRAAPGGGTTLEIEIPPVHGHGEVRV
jgi:two-component system sensor histidine kinase UhpB